jgi:hypothetical protein
MKKISTITEEGTGRDEMNKKIIKSLEMHLQRAKEGKIDAIFMVLIGEPLPEYVAEGVDPSQTCGASSYIGPEALASIIMNITSQATASTLLPTALKYALSTGKVAMAAIPIDESPEDSSDKHPAQSPVH